MHIYTCICTAVHSPRCFQTQMIHYYKDQTKKMKIESLKTKTLIKREHLVQTSSAPCCSAEGWHQPSLLGWLCITGTPVPVGTITANFVFFCLMEMKHRLNGRMWIFPAENLVLLCFNKALRRNKNNSKRKGNFPPFKPCRTHPSPICPPCTSLFIIQDSTSQHAS